MAELDLLYLCRTIGNLAGVPIRLYRGRERVFFFSQSYLPCDPVSECIERIMDVSENVGYVMTECFHCYGIVNSSDGRIVIGPTRQIEESEQELRDLAFRLDVPEDEIPSFTAGMKGIVRMPFESILQILCTLDHVLNGGKLSLSDISIDEGDQVNILKMERRKEAEEKLAVKSSAKSEIHNTFTQEEAVMRIIRKGDTAALREWTQSAPAVRSGKMACGQLRQMKNTFIVTATLSSRSAIRGGMDINDALSLSDSYIRQCELLFSPGEIASLQYRMILDYTERVGRLGLGDSASSLLRSVSNYIQHHMSQSIRIDDIAKDVFLSRPYLSKRFKMETGEDLSSFIMREKTEEAKRLLRYSDKSLTAIALYLGFSSSSHFSRVFRKYTFLTPGEYRKKHGS